MRVVPGQTNNAAVLPLPLTNGPPMQFLRVRPN
jgi:hypothetical protein